LNKEQTLDVLKEQVRTGVFMCRNGVLGNRPDSWFTASSQSRAYHQHTA